MEKPIIREPEYNPEFKEELTGMLQRYKHFAYNNPEYSIEGNIAVIIHKGNNDIIKIYNNAFLGDVLIKVCSLDVDGDIYVINKDSRIYKRISDTELQTMYITDTDLILWRSIHSAEGSTHCKTRYDEAKTIIDHAHTALAKISQLDYTNRSNYIVIYHLDKSGFLTNVCATLDDAKDTVESGFKKNMISMFIDMNNNIIYALEYIDDSVVTTELTDKHLRNELEFLSSQTLEGH